MSEKIDRLRSWLERNKIFFDVTIAFLLALMTITVSISANAIAQNQNNLMKEENQPIFRFNLIEDYKDKNNSSDILEALEIYNDGKPIIRFSATSIALLEIYYSNYKENYTDDNYMEKYAFVPIEPYYRGSKDTRSNTGLLMTLYRYNPLKLTSEEDAIFNDINKSNYRYNPLEFTSEEDAIFNDINKSNRSTLYDSNVSTILNIINYDFSSYLNNKNNSKEYGRVDLHTYVRITYLDIYGEKHDDIYWVNNQEWGKLCEKDKIAFEKKYYQSNSIPYPDVIYVPPTKIINIVSESTSKYDSSEYNDLPGSGWYNYNFEHAFSFFFF